MTIVHKYGKCLYTDIFCAVCQTASLVNEYTITVAKG